MKILSTGIDISKWQGNFQLEKAVKEGFKFAIIKAGGGDAGLYTDPQFLRNYENAKKLGIPVGAYWFSKALTVDQAVKEADYFYNNCLKGKQFDLPVYMDVEHASQLDLGKRTLTDIIHAFLQRLESKNCWAGIYSSQSYFEHYMIDSELQRYTHWVARWATECNYSGSGFGMWQYGGEVNKIRSNKVAGVVCDQDYMLIDYPTLIKKAGKNGYGDAAEDSEAPPEAIPEDKEESAPGLMDSADTVMVFSLEEDGEKYLTKNFQVKEFASKDGSDPVFIAPILPVWCQKIRDKFGYAFSPNSAYRTVSHNASPAVGGAARSFHVYGKAIDIPAKGSVTPQMLYDFAEQLVGDTCEVGIYSWGIHMAFCKEKKRFKG